MESRWRERVHRRLLGGVFRRELARSSQRGQFKLKTVYQFFANWGDYSFDFADLY